MNRLQQLLDERMGRGSGCARNASSPDAASGAASCLFDPPQFVFQHRLFVPEHFEARYEYPLVVWLHSDHSSEWELDVIMEAMSLRNYMAIAPRAPRVSKRSKRLFRWGKQMADLVVAEEFAIECVDTMIDAMPVHPSRVFLAGVGSGGTIAQWIGLKHPERFAGVVSINGGFPNRCRALSAWKWARHLPVLFMQGENSVACDNDEVAAAMHLAHGAGLNYRFVRFAGAQPAASQVFEEAASEDLDSEMLATANRFMMGIVTETDIPLSPERPRTLGGVASPSATAFGHN